ncbi:LLM class flavin-dependent oxidoreductase [Gynurincola endophyticus]|uniref:LLM class flavin-dependent oxidoreductase n=1 Tax=Gynurincola endophyticus TaxID=2479004 RepID=UPI000F8EF9C4|nr:LLM class flavin-dependent oxidoreductase [Gynurincola endophyticus]
MKTIRYSVLDQTQMRSDLNAHEVFEESVELAQYAESLGFTRYWFSEHHNSRTLAGGSPEILIARIGQVTKTIKLGSGGIMLPNHSTLRIAEHFKVLEAMYPNRIDLGIGRAPGGDRQTAQLLNPSNTFDPKQYVQQIAELQFYFNVEEQKKPGNIKAIPVIDTAPSIWMLTSSGESAYLAAHFGVPISFAQFISPYGVPEALNGYRESFKPSIQSASPQTMVSFFAFCSEDETEVHAIGTMMDYRLLSFEKGRFEEIPTIEAALDYPYNDYDRARILENRKRMIVGTPAQVKAQIQKVIEETDAEEIMFATMTETKEQRFESYRLFAKVINEINDELKLEK